MTNHKKPTKHPNQHSPQIQMVASKFKKRATITGTDRGGSMWSKEVNVECMVEVCILGIYA